MTSWSVVLPVYTATRTNIVVSFPSYPWSSIKTKTLYIYIHTQVTYNVHLFNNVFKTSERIDLNDTKLPKGGSHH